MIISLNDLLNDGRLERLFSESGRDCALQLWILQIRSAEGLYNRLLYGRLLPYNHSDNTWHATDDDHFKPVGEYQAQIIRVNLYIRSSHTALLLEHLSDGQDLTRISKELKLSLRPKLASRVGETKIGLPLAYRPVSYLMNRDAPSRIVPHSPHGAAGAFSASISQIDKLSLFRINADFDGSLVSFIVEQLNSDTGLDFRDEDLWRFGELELLVFPTLDDSERELLSVGWKADRKTFAVKLNTIQLPHYNRFHVRLCVTTNSSQLIHASVATVECAEGGEFECEFEVPEQLHPISDGTEVEVYGSKMEDNHTGSLCCRWRIGYIREIAINGHLEGNSAGSIHLDWLEKVTKSPAARKRLEAAQAINQGGTGFLTRVGDRSADPWVPINLEVKSLIAKLHPPKSNGRFFDRLCDSNGSGRLDFVLWIKDLLVNNQNHQVLIFDPYFEDAGIGLIVPNAGDQGDYVVFTTLPKPPKQELWYTLLLGWFMKIFGRRKVRPPLRNRINNLLASCDQLKPLLKRVRLRVYGLKDGALHDRYILIVGKDGLPVSGFNLSNSIQKANENYPLLITPIPADVLLKVLKYASGLLSQAAEEPSNDDEAGSTKIQLIFDSKWAQEAPRKRFEPLTFLNNNLAGDVLAEWTGEQSLRRVKGEALKQRMREVGLLIEESLVLKDTPGLKGCVDFQTSDFGNFKAKWEVLGDILADTPAGNMLDTAELSANTAFLNFLAHFLSNSFCRVHSEEVDAPISHVATSFFQKSTQELLTASYKPHHFFHPVKYTVLTWAEYFAVKILWAQDPDALVSITETQTATVQAEIRQTEAVKLSLLSQILSEVSLGAELGLPDVQKNRLLRSANGLLKWMGLNALESQLKHPDGVSEVIRCMSSFSDSEKIQTLGWMINHFGGHPDRVTIFRGLVDSLIEILPPKIDGDGADFLVHSLRGHMRRLSWYEPWLFQDVISPLMAAKRIAVDDLCRIWANELVAYLEDTLKGEVEIFKRNSEGYVTEVAAYLFGLSSLQQQKRAIKALRKVLDKVRRDVQQPLASTLNWGKWNISLVVAMWILAFTRWVSHFMTEPSGIEPEIKSLSNETRRLALLRPVSEWKSRRGVEPAGLARFIEETGEI